MDAVPELSWKVVRMFSYTVHMKTTARCCLAWVAVPGKHRFHQDVGCFFNQCGKQTKAAQ